MWNVLNLKCSLREKCPKTEFFDFCIFMYLVQLRENTDQKTPYLKTFFAVDSPS